MKNIKFLLPILTAFLLLSCDDYLDINEDPNNVQFENVPPRLLLPGAQSNSYRVQATTMNQLGNVFMNSWAGNVNAFTGGYAREFSLTLDNTFYSAIWDNSFSAIKNYQVIIEYDNVDGSQDYYIAIAKILKANYMQYLVDLYGDVPFTEAFQDLNNITPKYNDDQFIYRELITELEEARDIIDNSTTGTAVGSGEDVIFRGDMDLWKQFANTIELRMLLRMSNNTGATATYRDTKLASLSGETFLTQNATINPGYMPSNDDQLNPFYGNYLTDAAGSRLNNNRFVCASGHIRNFLNGSSDEIEFKHNSGTGTGKFYPGVVDPRRGQMWRLSGGIVKGVPQGLPSGSADVDSPSVSALGFYLFTPYSQIPLPSGTGTANKLPLSASDGYVMSLMESEFIQAEAALRYPSYFSGAESHFNAGVQESFAYLSATPNYAAYNTDITGIAGLAWTNDFNADLEAIMTQKWIALTSVNAIESYIDYTRTGFPITPLAATASEVRKPYRLIYPLSEYLANTANVPVITQSDLFTINSLSPFWLQGDPALGN